jgi:expansin (peptidoglycan-binding protein)
MFFSTSFTTIAVAALAAFATASPVKRGFGGRGTFYAVGLGACGNVNTDAESVVALNAAQYGSGYPGPECGKQIQITANGKTETATIVDLCPGCGHGDLDLSPSLFEKFAHPDVGVLSIDWEFTQ